MACYIDNLCVEPFDKSIHAFTGSVIEFVLDEYTELTPNERWLTIAIIGGVVELKDKNYDVQDAISYTISVQLKWEF